DDDVDILMKRSEFERLLTIIDDELARRPQRLFAYLGRKESLHAPYARYVNTAIPFITRPIAYAANYPSGIFLDIFILDPVARDQLDEHVRRLEESEEWFHQVYEGVVGRA